MHLINDIILLKVAKPVSKFIFRQYPITIKNDSCIKFKITCQKKRIYMYVAIQDVLNDGNIVFFSDESYKLLWYIYYILYSILLPYFMKYNGKCQFFSSYIHLESLIGKYSCIIMAQYANQ